MRLPAPFTFNIVTFLLIFFVGSAAHDIFCAYPCGLFLNTTPFKAKLAKVGRLKIKKDRCNIHNWNHGKAFAGWKGNETVPCKTKVERHAIQAIIDAFTFPNTTYVITWEGARSQYELEPNVYTRFRNGELVVCQLKENIPFCRVWCFTDALNHCIADAHAKHQNALKKHWNKLDPVPWDSVGRVVREAWRARWNIKYGYDW